MNRIGIATFMLIITAIICGCEYYTVTKDADDFTSSLENVYELMENGEYSKAQELSEDLTDKFYGSSEKLDKYLYHDYVDDISKNLSVLPVYVKNQDTSTAHAVIEEIKIQLASLRNSELPYLHNIL